ncbi:hypothetical protein [Methylocystis parvus]|uniref:hypothetical protein n=1 Tax=Methylocystis parvus TaxID=134 RepID=UPI003C75122F
MIQKSTAMPAGDAARAPADELAAAETGKAAAPPSPLDEIDRRLAFHEQAEAECHAQLMAHRGAAQTLRDLRAALAG